jgi:hypothetical protein
MRWRQPAEDLSGGWTGCEDTQWEAGSEQQLKAVAG